MKGIVRITPKAISDIKAIKKFVAEDSPERAKIIGDNLYSKIESLSSLQDRGIPLSSKINVKTDYRFLVCGS